VTTVDVAVTTPAELLQPRPAGFLHDLAAIAGRALRAVPRDLETVFPPVFIAVFFFLVNIATLEGITEGLPGSVTGPNFDFESFQMATAVLLGVTGVSRAPALVLDVQDGYFDRLLLTPIRRLAILLGHMTADIAISLALTVPVILIGFVVGVRFESGPLGVLGFMLLAALWSLAFSGFAYAIALKTGNPGAVNTSFMLFFPFLFLTSSYVPREALSGWLDTVAGFNPVTYLLEGLRSLTMEGWEWGDLGSALLAVGIVGALSMSLCFGALRGRIRRGG
jgi:ABC-2 type transport system permease protein